MRSGDITEADRAVQAFRENLRRDIRVGPARVLDDGSTVVPIQYTVGTRLWTHDAQVWPRGVGGDIEPETSGIIAAVQADRIVTVHQESGSYDSEQVAPSVTDPRGD